MAALLVISLGVALIVAGLLSSSSEAEPIALNRTAVALAQYQDMRTPSGNLLVFRP